MSLKRWTYKQIGRRRHHDQTPIPPGETGEILGTITVDQPQEGGSITPSGVIEYRRGQKLMFTAIPKDGWGFSYWTLNELDQYDLIKSTLLYQENPLFLTF